MAKVERLAPDLSDYPDMVVIYLGMQVRAWYGLKTLIGFGPKISGAVGEKPDGLLLHENILWSLFPPHAGMRQYWRDFDALERWARDDPHAAWWRGLLADMGGTGFWHETYHARGGMESVYLDMPPTGLSAFTSAEEAKGSLFSARRRMRMAGDTGAPSPVSERDLYG